MGYFFCTTFLFCWNPPAFKQLQPNWSETAIPSVLQELYIFNKFGQHVLTKDIMTSSVVYRMSYTQATSNGRLDSVTDAAGRKLTVMRDLRGQVSERPLL